eukprot:COSAG01_NODE_61285_length_290_cov_0.916230_1_plen_44_part_01
MLAVCCSPFGRRVVSPLPSSPSTHTGAARQAARPVLHVLAVHYV